MWRLGMITVALLALTVAGAAVAGPRALDYSWTVSGSSTDPSVFEGPAISGPGSLFLWLDCAAADGAAAAEFEVEVTGDLFFSNFTPVLGVLNFGSGAELVLGLGGCRDPDFLAGTLNFFGSGGGGTVCLANTTLNDRNVTVDCDPVEPVTHENGFHGWTSTGGSSCLSSDSCTDAVDADTWAGVKSLYR